MITISPGQLSQLVSYVNRSPGVTKTFCSNTPSSNSSKESSSGSWVGQGIMPLRCHSPWFITTTTKHRQLKITKLVRSGRTKYFSPESLWEFGTWRTMSWRFEDWASSLDKDRLHEIDPLANYQFHHPSNPQQPIHSLRLAPVRHCRVKIWKFLVECVEQVYHVNSPSAVQTSKWAKHYPAVGITRNVGPSTQNELFQLIETNPSPTIRSKNLVLSVWTFKAKK